MCLDNDIESAPTPEPPPPESKIDTGGYINHQWRHDRYGRLLVCLNWCHYSCTNKPKLVPMHVYHLSRKRWNHQQ